MTRQVHSQSRVHFMGQDIIRHGPTCEQMEALDLQSCDIRTCEFVIALYAPTEGAGFYGEVEVRIETRLLQMRRRSTYSRTWVCSVQFLGVIGEEYSLDSGLRIRRYAVVYDDKMRGGIVLSRHQ